MRYFLSVLAALLMIFNGNAQETITYTAKIKGMSCNYCTNSVNKKFKKLPGISQLNIDLETGMLSFVLPKEKSFTIEEIEDKIKKTGYTPVWVKASEAEIGTKPVGKNMDESNGLITVSIFVKGNCGMCKDRIEEATTKVKGVKEANWDSETQQLKVVFNDKKTSLVAIEKKIASVGHDTEHEEAPDSVYNNLHGCCKYDREATLPAGKE